MRTAYFDCFSGISGDMTLGALIACGADVGAIRAELAKLHLDGWDLTAEPTERNGIGAVDVTVTQVAELGHGRHLHHIEEILQASELSDNIRSKALAVFQKLAVAEAKVHQTTVERIHFHEVGAIDAIVDIVGACIALELLGIGRIVCSPLPMSHGFVECMHGTIPIPAPAVLEMLAGVPVYSVDIVGELVTPTGAALMVALAAEFGPAPAMTVGPVGYGAGKKSFGNRPNLLRVIVGDSQVSEEKTEIMCIETNIDDMSPQFYELAFERMFAAGALDVYTQPIQMKKGRPATLLTALAPKECVQAVAAVFFAETTTFGVRMFPAQRMCLERRWVPVTTPYGEVRIKCGTFQGVQTTASPEYDDVRRCAEACAVPLKRVHQAAMMAYEES